MQNLFVIIITYLKLFKYFTITSKAKSICLEELLDDKNNR